MEVISSNKRSYMESTSSANVLMSSKAIKIVHQASCIKVFYMEDLLLEILSDLDPHDPPHNLLECSKELLELKKVKSYNFTIYGSIYYATNYTFRNEINSKIKNSNHQISLNYSGCIRCIKRDFLFDKNMTL